LALAAWTLRHVVLVLFGALVLANGMSFAAVTISRKWGVRYALALGLIVAAGLAVVCAVGWFFGATIMDQLDELKQRIPDGAQWLRKQIEAHPYARDMVSNFDVTDLSGPTGYLAQTLAPQLKLVAATAWSLIITAIVSVYLAAQPDRYRSGLLLLAPPASRSTAERLFNAISGVLARWLLGQFAVMATVGILSGLGLWMLGIKAAFVLGLVGGLLSFVPFFGSILTAVLAALFALAQGPAYAIAVLAMYVAVHFIEGNFVTPIIQSEATSLPPALTLISVLSCGILFGPPADFLAVPLALVVLTAIKVLYVEPMAESAQG
jgi:predicted PurR-regulated permease PerM